MTDRELMQFLFEVLDKHVEDPSCENLIEKTCKLLRDRLAQPEYEFECPRCGHCCQQREWVGLTDDEIYDYADKFLYQHGSNFGIKSFGKAIEAKLKEKNT